MKLTNLFTYLLMLSCLFAMAQPTNLGQLELSVTDKYKATVAQANKISTFPSFKDTTAQKLPVNYKITSVPLPVTYRAKPLPPAQIAKVPVENLKQGLVRVGGGFYGTALAEVYWHSKRSSQQAYGFFGNHLSTQRGVADIIYINNSFSSNNLGGYYNRFFRKLKWENGLSFYANKQSYYGVPDIENQNFIGFDEKAPAIWRRGLQYQTNLENTSEKRKNFVGSKLAYNLFTDSYNTFENNVANLNEFILPAGNIPLFIDLGLEYTQTVYDSIVPSQFIRSSLITQVRPHIETVYNDTRFDFGLNVYTNSLNLNQPNDTSYTKFYFFPELTVTYPLVKDVLSAYTSLKGRLLNNTLRSLSDANPFIGPEQNLQASFERNLEFGLKGILSATSSFNLSGGYLNVSNQVLYYRNPLIADSSGLSPLNVLYDDAEIWYLRGELGLNYANNLQIDLFGEVRSYDTKTEKLAWHLPNFIAGLQATYTLKEKILLGIKTQYIGAREAFAQELNPQLNSTLNGYVNTELSVQYLYNSRLSAFIKAFNLLNTENALYLGYNAQQVNVLFGIGYQF